MTMFIYFEKTKTTFHLEWKNDMLFKHWLWSTVYENNDKMLYFGLTFFGLSVTIQKKSKNHEENRNHRNQTEKHPN